MPREKERERELGWGRRLGNHAARQNFFLFEKRKQLRRGNRSGKNAARQSWGMEAEEEGMVISFWKIRLAGEVPGEKKLGRRLGNHAEEFFLEKKTICGRRVWEK